LPDISFNSNLILPKNHPIEKSMKSFLKTRVMIVENDQTLSESYQCLINWTKNFAVVGTYCSGEDAIKFINKVKPEIVLVDVDLPGMDGIECCRIIKGSFPKMPVIILSLYEDSELCFTAFKSGACGFLTKGSDYVQIIEGLEEVMKGGAALSPAISRMVVNKFRVTSDSPLSERQTQVLKFLSEGKTYLEIADRLNISKETSRSHIKSIYSKLNVHSKSDAISFAHQNHLI
jgi:DNA-binding NarL/FixJ family response regulator